MSNKTERNLVDLIDGNGIAGASVYLVKETSNGLLAPTSGEVVMTTTTDSVGEFSLEFKQSGGDYTVYVRKNGYYDERNVRGVQSYITLSGHVNLVKKKTTLYLQEPVYIDILLRNISGFPVSATISFPDIYDTNFKTSTLKCTASDTTVSIMVPANTTKETFYEVVSSGQIIDGNFSIPAIPPFQHANLELQY